MRGALLIAAATLAPVLALAEPYSDNAIDDRISGSAISAEALQGPLDGAWTLVSAAGAPIYDFQLVDKPGGESPIEGVWRDLRRPATPGDIGLIDQVARSPTALTITLNARPGQQAVVITLRPDPAGGWSGELREGAATTQVRLRRG